MTARVNRQNEFQTARDILKPLDRCHPVADKFDSLPLLAETAFLKSTDDEVFLAG